MHVLPRPIFFFVYAIADMGAQRIGDRYRMCAHSVLWAVFVVRAHIQDRLSTNSSFYTVISLDENYLKI